MIDRELVIRKMAEEIYKWRYDNEVKMGMPDGFYEQREKREVNDIIREYTTTESEATDDETN